MSRWQLPLKAGIVMALAAFVIGITAASALGWGSGGETEKPPSSGPKHDQGKDNDEDEGKGGKGNHEQPKPKPPETAPTPPAGQQVPPATTPPVAQAPPAPVVSQGTPTTPAQPAPLPPEQESGGGVPQSPVVAAAPPAASAPTTPVANRTQLAKTGLDPALIALLGALCLGGGGFLFRRALART
jgi:LPXTG-motif cell wall-anchored protein